MKAKLIVIFVLIVSDVWGKFPPCYRLDKTWHSDDVTDVLTGVDNAYVCQESCASSDCSGFTYYADIHPHFPQACFLFHSLSREEACADCVSGPATCTCSAEYSCDLTHDNIIDVFPSTQSETQCQNICFNSPECTFYTYFSEDNVMEDICYIFRSCPEIDENCVGCFSGPKICTSSTTDQTQPSTTSVTTRLTTTLRSTTTSGPTITPIRSTTTSKPTTTSRSTTTSRPTTTMSTTISSSCESIFYWNLTDETRNVNYQIDLGYCDRDGVMAVSPDWQGPGWYRISGKAGLQLPEYPPSPIRSSCGTDWHGWLDGSHPQIWEGEVERRVFFNNDDGYNCDNLHSVISVINCGAFYLYNLPNTYCVLRYCGA